MSSARFDPSLPIDYTKLGGDPAQPTPTQYSWLTSFFLRLYHYSPIRPVIQFLYNTLSKTYVTTFSFLTHQIYRFVSYIPRTIFTQPHEFYKTTLQPFIIRFFTSPATFARNHPLVTTFFFSIIFSYLVLFDYETDLLHTPYWPINDPTSALGSAIETGRKIRRALGGRTFYEYQQDKLSAGELTPTKQAFVNHYGAFVDEVEWNYHHNFIDTDISVALVVSQPNVLSPQDVETQIELRRLNASQIIEDELFRQRELFAEKRIKVMDKLYNETQWDLRDGSVIPPGSEPDNLYKPYRIVPPNPNNPIPHHLPGSGSLGNTTFREKQGFWSKEMKTDARAVKYGEFDVNLDLQTTNFIPHAIPDKPLEVPGDQDEYDQYREGAHGEIESMFHPDGTVKRYEDFSELPPNPIPRQRAPGLDRWARGGSRASH